MSLFADDCVMHLGGNNWIDKHNKIQHDFDCILEWTFEIVMFKDRHGWLRAVSE